MDSTQLERETLETKDRDELVTIATALGGKPGSRARKAEIVDLILEMTAGSKGGSNGSSAKAAEKTEEAEEEPLAEWEVEAAAEAATEEVKKSDKEAADSSDEKKEDSSEERGSRSQTTQNRQNDPAGPGNRRRRRRGGRDQASEEPWDGEPVSVEGYVYLRDEGYGFLRTTGFKPSKTDAYISVKQVRQLNLRKGDYLVGGSRPPNRSEKNPALLRIDTVNGGDPEGIKDRPKFEDLTPLFPDEKLSMEISDDPGNMTARIIALLSPIG